MKIKDKENLNCKIKQRGKKILLAFSHNASLTDLREFIAQNSKNIKNLQRQIREEYKINREKRARGRYPWNETRDERIFELSKKPISELIEMIKDNGAKEKYKNTKYKDIVMAKIINQDIHSHDIFGEMVEDKEITPENIRKIISREKSKIKLKT